MSPMQMAVLRHVGLACRLQADGRYGAVDLHKVSEGLREKLIDLAMRDPPLVDVDGPRVIITEAGRALLRALAPICPRDGFPCARGCQYPCDD